MRAYDRAFYANNKDRRRQAHKLSVQKYEAANREKIAERKRLYQIAKPEVFRRAVKKLRSTPHGRIHSRMSRAIRLSISGKGGLSWQKLVGYTTDELKSHLESLFTEGMTWEALLRAEIHIDHKIPKAMFRFTSAEDPQFKACWALSNLQPLWAKDNLRKGCKFAA